MKPLESVIEEEASDIETPVSEALTKRKKVNG